MFGYDDDKDKEELEQEEELDKRFKNLISKKRLEAFKKSFKKAEYIDPQIKVNVLKKKLNNLPETSSDDNDDSEDNQISNFVDEVLKKVSKEIVNDDNKKVSKEIVNDDNKKVSKEIVNDDNKKNADVKKNQIKSQRKIE